MTGAPPVVAIVDCTLGNLFSIRHALGYVGLEARITHDPRDIVNAAAVVLPGVGAFGKAMNALNELGITPALREVAASGKPLVGVCLGLQLLFSRSSEFGEHAGLGLIEGDVVRLVDPAPEAAAIPRPKVPFFGWNRIVPDAGAADGPWPETLLDGVPAGTFMYFVHSYYVRPADPRGTAVAWAEFGGLRYCAAVRQGNVQAFQFHPERSGENGLRVFRNLARRLNGSRAA